MDVTGWDSGTWSAAAVVAGSAISMVALVVSLAAWRASRRAASAAEQTSLVDRLRLHGDMKPQWVVTAEKNQYGGDEAEVWLTLAGPPILTSPVQVKIHVSLTLQGEESWHRLDFWYRQVELGKSSQDTAWESWKDLPGDPAPMQKDFGKDSMRVGDKQFIRLYSLPHYMWKYGPPREQILALEITTQLATLDPWTDAISIAWPTKEPTSRRHDAGG